MNTGPPFRAKNNAVVSFDKANQAIVLGTTLEELQTLGYTTRPSWRASSNWE